MASQNESIPDLIRGTIRDGLGLVRDEIFLARTELREEITRVKSALITIVAAGAVGVLAVVMLLNMAAWGVVYAFDWPTWAGFAIVALPLVIITAVLVVMGRSLLTRDRIMP